MQLPFMPFRLRLTIAARYVNFLEKVMYCAVVAAFLLSMPLTQQPLKLLFEFVANLTRSTPNRGLKRFRRAAPLDPYLVKFPFVLTLFTVYHLQ
jgi:hypothetical protein